MELELLQKDRKRIVQLPIENENGEIETFDLAIWHKPITVDLLNEIDQVDCPDNETLATHLSLVMTRWDMTEKGKPVKPTLKVLLAQEIEFLILLKNAIFEPVYPKKAT